MITIARGYDTECRTLRVVDTTPTVFVVDGDAVRARLAAAPGSGLGVARRDVRVRAGVPGPASRPGSELPDHRRRDARLRRARRAATRRGRSAGDAGRLHRVRRPSHGRPGDEGRRRGVPRRPVARRGAGRRHRIRARSQPARPGAPGQAHGAARELPVADAAGARGDGPGRVRPPEQAGRRRAGHQRDHRQGASGPGDAQDEGRLTPRAGAHGGRPRPAHRAVRFARYQRLDTFRQWRRGCESGFLCLPERPVPTYRRVS